jgi:hypothetical protein
VWLASSSSTSHSTRGILTPTQHHPNSATPIDRVKQRDRGVSLPLSGVWSVLCVVGVVWSGKGRRGRLRGGRRCTSRNAHRAITKHTHRQASKHRGQGEKGYCVVLVPVWSRHVAVLSLVARCSASLSCPPTLDLGDRLPNTCQPSTHLHNTQRSEGRLVGACECVF